MAILVVAAVQSATVEARPKTPHDSSPTRILAQGPRGSSTSATRSMLATRPAVPLLKCKEDPAWLCGSIEVPLDRAHPAARKLSIGFTVLPHSDPTSTARDAVFVSDGGPGFANSAGRGFRQFMLGPVTEQRDLVLMDHRGTGTSGAIDCSALQTATGGAESIVTAVGACGKQLGDDADRYGSGDVALDMEAVRRALRYPRISYYAQSYGTVAIAAYATRFPHRLRAVVADAGLPVTDARHTWSWGLDNPRAYARTAGLTCRRAPACAAVNPRAAGSLTRLAKAVRRHPVAGSVPTSAGGRRHVVVDEPALITISSDVLNGGELPAAERALRHGDKTPLLRLGAETSGPQGEPEDPAQDSVGDNAAAFCNDADFVWNRADPVPVRRTKYRRALGALGPDALPPFSPAAWTEFGITDFCLRWPAPDRFTPALAHRTGVTGMPVLILSGDLDTVVATATTRALLRTFPHATFRRVAGAEHPAAGFSGCARTTLQKFIQTPHRGVGTCHSPDYVAPAAAEFAPLARTSTAASILAGDTSTRLDRKIATVVVHTVRDAWLRVFRIPSTKGELPGLRGGTATFDQETFPDHAVVRLRGARYA